MRWSRSPVGRNLVINSLQSDFLSPLKPESGQSWTPSQLREFLHILLMLSFLKSSLYARYLRTQLNLILLVILGGSDGKESVCIAGDPGRIPGSGRSPEEGIGYPLQYSWASLVVQMVKNLPAMQTWVRSLGWEDPLEKGIATHSSILAWRIPWTEKPGGFDSAWGWKESDTTEWLSTA